MTQPFFNVRTVVGLTTVSRKNLSKKTRCRGRGHGMTPDCFAKILAMQQSQCLLAMTMFL
ncbi:MULTISPECIES: hypothetical protein [unclassified Rickettsia]|uniref:hypothetical protein n=1 Tax=unclassified Rickettsia TaxID=114295 RepID=UPI0031331FEA